MPPQDQSRSPLLLSRIVKDMLKTMAAAGNTLATPKAKIVKNCVYNTRY